MPAWSTLIAIYIVGEWLIRLALSPFVIRRHNAQAALAWLGLIFFVPYIGLVMYIILGSSPMARRRVKAYVRCIKGFETPERLAPLRPYITPIRRIDPSRRDVVRLAERLGHFPIVGGHDVDLVTSTRDMVARLITDIDNAKHSVHLLYYIYRNDSTGIRVGEALIRAARRGVACRLLVDDVGSKQMLRVLGPALVESGVEVRSALPVRLFRGFLARVDTRNHRKLAIIDSTTAYTGSHNIADPTYGHDDKQGNPVFGPWRDMSVRLTGPAVYQLQLLFLESWAFETGEPPEKIELAPPPEPAGEVHIQCVPSGPGHRGEAYRGVLVDAIHEADKRVIMTTPYLVPDEAFILALRLSALGGVQVDIVVPARSNHPLVNAAARACFDTLVDAGVRIHRHTQGLLHAKTITVDDSFGLVGTGNFDMRSFSLNLELSLLFFGEGQIRRLREEQERYISESEPIDPEAWLKRPVVHQLVDHTAKLFGPLL